MMMPARTAIAAVLVGVLLGSSGCGVRVAGTDGDLVDDWAPMAAAKFDLPSVGMCLDSPSKAPFDPAFARARPIECERGHTLEVVLVGAIDGSAAQASEPPAPGSEGFRAAYAACGKAASDYAGGDWHTGMLGIDVQLPTRAPWGGGLRSYVCSIFALSSAYGGMSFTSGSLKGSLAGDAPKAIHCLEVVGNKGTDGWWDGISALTPIDCAKPHEAEFVGSVQIGSGAGGALPAEDVLKKWTTDICWPVVATFMGLSRAQRHPALLRSVQPGQEGQRLDQGTGHEAPAGLTGSTVHCPMCITRTRRRELEMSKILDFTVGTAVRS